MFKRIVAIEPVNLTADTERGLRLYAEEVCMYRGMLGDDQEIIRRIGDGNGIFISYTSKISAHVVEGCPSIRYIGICRSLHPKESANADITCARKSRITMLGTQDYSDRGVAEFAISELVRFLHGCNRPLSGDMSIEITDLKVGIAGIGVFRGMIADATWFMGADVSYYSRTRKAERESQGMTHRPLKEFLEYSEVVFACLNKNAILLHKEEFKQPGTGKLLFSASIDPVFDILTLGEWLDQGGNYFICNTEGALGDPAEELLKRPHVVCAHRSVGRTRQVFDLLSKKVLDNLRTFLGA